MIANLVSGTFRVTTEFYKMAEVTGIFVLSSLAIFDGKKKPFLTCRRPSLDFLPFPTRDV